MAIRTIVKKLKNIKTGRKINIKKKIIKSKSPYFA